MRRAIDLGAMLREAATTNPVAFFFLFRWIPWTLAIIVVLSGAVPARNLVNEPEVLLYATLQLALGTLYTAILHPRLSWAPRSLPTERPPADLVAVGIADMVGTLVIVFFSGGWNSPFWHLAVTSLLVPCFLLPARWCLATATAFALAYVGTVALAEGGLAVALAVGQRHFFLGNLVTAFLVAIAVAYLGHVLRVLQEQRRRTRQALDQTEVLFRIAENVVQGGTDLENLLARLTQVMRAQGVFPVFALFLIEEDSSRRLAAASVGVEEIAVATDGQEGDIVARAASTHRTSIARTDLKGTAAGWLAAVPLIADKGLEGVMVVGAQDHGPEELGYLTLADAIGSQIALGIHNVRIARRMADVAAQQERALISREIHDGVAQALYVLGLHLETLAEAPPADREKLAERVQGLVRLSKQTLLEVRHYIFDLRPYLEGMSGLVQMVEDQAQEFSKVTGVRAAFHASGAERPAPIRVATNLFRITQEALSNVFKHAHATEVLVALDFTPDQAVRLTVEDNGDGWDPESPPAPGHGLTNMRLRAEEAGGSFSWESRPGQGLRIIVSLPF